MLVGLSMVGIVTSQSSAVSPQVLTALVTMNADDAGLAGGTFAGQAVASGDQMAGGLGTCFSLLKHLERAQTSPGALLRGPQSGKHVSCPC